MVAAMLKEKIRYIMWFDTETTGLNPLVNDIVQWSYIIEHVDLASGERGEVLVERDLFLRPLAPDKVELTALEKNGLTMEQILQFPPPGQAMKTFRDDHRALKMNPYKDKFMMAGYNVDFDKNFLQNMFDVKLNKAEGQFSAYIYYAPYLCVMQHAFSRYVADALTKNAYPDKLHLQLKDAASLVIPPEELAKVSFHNALDDIRTTRDIWYKLNGL